MFINHVLYWFDNIVLIISLKWDFFFFLPLNGLFLFVLIDAYLIAYVGSKLDWSDIQNSNPFRVFFLPWSSLYLCFPQNS